MSRLRSVLLLVAVAVFLTSCIQPPTVPVPAPADTATPLPNRGYNTRTPPTATPWPSRWYDAGYVSRTNDCVQDGAMLVCGVYRRDGHFASPIAFTLSGEIERLTGYPVTRESDIAVIVEPEPGRSCGTSDHPAACPAYEYWADAPSVVFRPYFGWNVLTMDAVKLTIGPVCSVYAKAQKLGLTSPAFDNQKDMFIRGTSRIMPDGSYRVGMQSYRLPTLEKSIRFDPVSVDEVDPARAAVDFGVLVDLPACP